MFDWLRYLVKKAALEARERKLKLAALLASMLPFLQGLSPWS